MYTISIAVITTSMKKHTNIINEITGEYYRSNSFFEEQIDWGMIGWTVAMMGVCGVIYLVAF